MSATSQRERSQRMAADLIARGYPHGRRRSSPFPNSGGMTMSFGPGSSKYQRLVAKQRRAAEDRRRGVDDGGWAA